MVETIAQTKHFLHHVDNGDGWKLALHQTYGAKLDPRRRPVLIVPGYGMNSFIFSYHPNGPSLEGYLVSRGLEVWRVDLRAQGDSISTGGTDQFMMEDLALTDLGVAVKAVLARTRTKAKRVDVIGASLGGTLMLAHAVLVPEHRLGSLVSIGSPVRWVYLNPVLRAAFSWPWLVGQLRFAGTRKMAELALPQLVRFVPWALTAYINPEITDTRAAKELVKTVEDPNRFINRQIAEWVKERDLYLRGVNIAEGLGRVEAPYMCVLANKDGIVPRATAMYAYLHVASRERRLLEVGSRELRVAHADLFVSNAAHAHVFSPIADWLESVGPGTVHSEAAE
jgi:pimeloyl-ACP methyl ester carboxylesterase